MAAQSAHSLCRWERILLLSRKWNYVSLRYGKTTMTLNFILKELNNDGKN